MEATIDGYSFHIQGDSDDGGISDSSEELDEVDVFLRGTPEQQRRMIKNLTGDEASSSDDDFEKVMNKELDNKIKTMEKDFWKSTKPVMKKKTNSVNDIKDSKTQEAQSKYYDDIYFDSDEEAECSKQGTGVKHKILSNDELFYDPNADDEDEEWVNNHRRKIQRRMEKNNKLQPKPVNDSDAVLNCPACMTTLCLDCQRHTTYKYQYRAMFVMNCNVKHDEVLHYKKPKKRSFKRHRNRNKSEEGPMSSENFERNSSSLNTNVNESIYNPVNCSKCSTEVAVFDSDEVYHFFNVLASHC